MKLEKPQELNNTLVYSFVSPEGDCQVLISVFGGERKKYFLSSIRFIDTSEAKGDFKNLVAAQCNNLKGKVDFIESKEFCPVNYSGIISCGRVFVLSKGLVCLEKDFSFIRDCINEFQKITNFHLILQPDYDQFLIKEELSKYIDIPSFRLNHIPSAYSTVVPFAETLEQLGIIKPSIGILGIGNLGGEIIRLFKERYPDAHLYVTDKDYQKFLPFDNLPLVHWVEMDRFYSLGYDAVIFCANNGSFTLDAASHIISMDMPKCRCVGGPEAGLDSSLESVLLVEEANIIYVPSRLCGSLGLLTNLNEVLGITYDFDEVKENYDTYIKSIVRHLQLNSLKLSDCLNNRNHFLTEV